MSLEEDISVHLTQSTLGKYVSKPNLSDKLLRKPPFRFLHDIICVVINDTGYLKGLFTVNELISANVKERDAKVAFLSKLISAVKATTKIDLKVRASKVIAGLEPIETNKLFQAIAKAIDDKVNSTGYVSSLSGAPKEKAIKPSKASSNKMKETRSVGKSSSKTDELKTKTKTVSKEPQSSTRSSSKASVSEKKVRDKKTVEKKSSKDSIPSTDRKQQKRNDNKHKKDEAASKINTPKEIERTHKTIKEELVLGDHQSELVKSINIISDNLTEEAKPSLGMEEKVSSSNLPMENGNVENIIQEKDSAEIKPAIERPKTAKISNNMTQVIKDNQTNATRDSVETKASNNQEQTTTSIALSSTIQTDADKLIPNQSESTISVRKPPTARPRSSLRPPSARPGTARPAAPRFRPPSSLPLSDAVAAIGGNVKVVVEHYRGGKDDDAEDDDEEETVIIQQNLDDWKNTSSVSSVNNALDDTVDAAVAAASKSHLVGQIMAQVGQEDAGPGTVRGGKQIQVQLFQDKPVAELGVSIQTVTQSANMLGQLMGYLHEDIDAMRSELEQWSQVASATMADADKRRTELAERARPLRARLQEVEDEIQKQKEEIATLQYTVHSDQRRIESLLRREVEGVGDPVAVPMYD